MSLNMLIAEDLGRRLLSQNNRATVHPIFLVQQKRRVYGFDPQYGGDTVWLHCDGAEATAEEAEELNEKLEDGEDPPGEWCFTGFVDEWDFVQCFFTEDAANHFIEANRHKGFV